MHTTTAMILPERQEIVATAYSYRLFRIQVQSDTTYAQDRFISDLQNADYALSEVPSWSPLHIDGIAKRGYNSISHVLLINLSLISWLYRHFIHCVSKISTRR
jgi:hypothetical protein